MIVVSLSFLFALISSITCAFINGSTSKTDLKEGNSVDVTFKLTFAEGEKLVLFKILNNDKIIAQDAGSSFGLTEYARSIFGGRISSTSPISGSYIYKLTISDLLANDSMTLTAELLYSNPAEVYLKTNAAIPININADPVVLSFSEVLFVKEGDPLFFESKIYGKPKPVSIVTLTEKIFNAKSSNEIQNNTYNFVYDLGQLTANDCGVTLVLNVSGNGKVFNQSAAVYVQFTPPKVALLSLIQLTDFSVIAKWKPIASGKCYVSYNVEFLNSTNQIVYQYNGTNTTEILATNSANATSIKIYAVFNSTIGEPFIQDIPSPQTTTTTTTTTSTTIKSSTTQGSQALARTGGLEAGSIIGIAVGAVVFIIIVGVIIVFIVKRKSTSSSKHPNNKIGGVNNPVKADGLPLKDKRRSFEETDYPPPASKKSQDPDQMIYAQLGAGGGRTGPKPNPINSNYAEIKVDDMGYPARGPTSDRLPSNPPPYDGTRRNSRPPSEEFDGGIIV